MTKSGHLLLRLLAVPNHSISGASSSSHLVAGGVTVGPRALAPDMAKSGHLMSRGVG